MTARQPLDAYYTPQALATHLVGLLPIQRGETALEPHVGGGAFASALVDKGAHVFAMDINPHAPGFEIDGVIASHVHDFLTFEDGPWCPWVVGNPPYSEAEAHVRKALKATSQHVVFLLRLAFLESKKRIPFWEQNPCRKVWVLSERPSFVGTGTDTCAYGWFWWDNQHQGPTELEITSWKNNENSL